MEDVMNVKEAMGYTVAWDAEQNGTAMIIVLEDRRSCTVRELEQLQELNSTIT